LLVLVLVLVMMILFAIVMAPFNPQGASSRQEV